MPMAAPRLCPKHGPFTGRECRACAKARPRRPDTDRPNARQRGYTKEWEKERAAFLKLNRRCRCGAEATVVDHIIPHKGDDRLFWDRSNWRAMCAPCHNRKTATMDGGFGRKKRNPGAGQEFHQAVRDRRGKSPF